MQAALTSNDQHLLDTYIREKSDDTFRALVERHAPWVFAAANRQLHDRQLAEDATQAVFILLIRRSPSMQSHHQLTAWLFKAVHYTVKNIQRARRRRDFHERIVAQVSPVTPTEPEKELELADQLDAAVASLSPDYRTAILLRFYQDMPFDQIAQSLNISEAAVRKRTTRAVDILRRRFGLTGALSTSSLALAATESLRHVPSGLTQSVAQAALAAKAGAAIPSAAAAAAKGAAYLMATAKLKTTIVLVAASLAILVPATVVTINYVSKPTAEPIAATEPMDYLSYYAPAPGQAFRGVDAPPEVRAAMYSALQSPGNPPFAAPTGSICFDWNDGHPQNVLILAQRQMSLSEAVVGMACLTFNLQPTDVEVKAAIRDEQITPTSDLVYNSALPLETRVTSLELFFKMGMKLDVKLTLSKVAGRDHLVIADAAGLAGFDQYYRLKPAETMALVTDAPQELRDAFLANGVPTGRKTPKGKVIMIRWANDKPYLYGYGDGVAMHDVLEQFMGVYPQMVDFHVVLPSNVAMEWTRYDMSSKLPILKGDLVVREGATAEEYRASLEKILNEALGRKIAVTFRNVQEKAVVLRGTWHYTPIEQRPGRNSRNIPTVDIYGPKVDEDFQNGIDAVGDLTSLCGHLGTWLKENVVVEAQQLPKAFEIHIHTLANTPEEAQARDKGLILKHLTEQTGLTASEEERPIRRMFIEEQK